MAHYSHTMSDSFVERLLASAAHLLERAAARHAHYRIYRDALAELRGLSDRDLTDLGLSRCMLRQLARETADKQVVL